jgi:hypothetical protein
MHEVVGAALGALLSEKGQHYFPASSGTRTQLCTSRDAILAVRRPTCHVSTICPFDSRDDEIVRGRAEHPSH